MQLTHRCNLSSLSSDISNKIKTAKVLLLLKSNKSIDVHNVNNFHQVSILLQSSNVLEMNRHRQYIENKNLLFDSQYCLSTNRSTRPHNE